jgi:hypothetical protein
MVLEFNDTESVLFISGEDEEEDDFNLPKSVVMGISIVWFIVFFSLFTLILLDPMKSSYYSVGPSDKLKLFPTDIPIDTWDKYISLVLYLVTSTFLIVMANDFVMPWINTVGLNIERTRKFSKRKKLFVFLIVNLWWVAIAIESVVVIGTSYSQIDFALASMIGSMSGGFFSGCIVILWS